MKTVEAKLFIETSFGNKSCEQFYVVRNEELSSKVHKSSKYSTETKQVEDTESEIFF